MSYQNTSTCENMKLEMRWYRRNRELRTGDGRLDQGILQGSQAVSTEMREWCSDSTYQLLVTANGELQMARGDTLDLEVLGGVSGQLEHLGGQVLKDGGRVDGSGGSDTSIGRGAALEHAVDTADGELQAGLAGAGNGGFTLGLKGIEG